MCKGRDSKWPFTIWGGSPKTIKGGQRDQRNWSKSPRPSNKERRTLHKSKPYDMDKRPSNYGQSNQHKGQKEDFQRGQNYPPKRKKPTKERN